MWHGSANFSDDGLLRKAEQVEASTDPDLIQRWLRWLEEVAGQSRNLMDDVLAELQAWLKLVDPFDVYLRALLILFGLPETPYQRGAHQPTYYQQALVAWSLRRLTEYRGALLVVATGLGKTVIGSEIAARLHRVRACTQILLIAPPTVHRAWKKQLVLSRKLPAQLFGCNALFNKLKGNDRYAADELNTLLLNADSGTLILIDEAHYYRNELLNEATKQMSEVIERLRPAIAQQARVVLLTGSVYGTNMQNPNSLLALLPPRPAPAPDSPATAWHADTCEELTQLPVVSVLGIPHVLKMARERMDVDAEDHPYIEFSDKNRKIERNYLPRKIRSRLVAFTPPLLKQTVRILDGSCCDQHRPRTTKNYDDEARKLVERPTDSVANQAVASWLSSPPAFERRLQKNLLTPGKNDAQLPLPFEVQAADRVATQGALALDIAPRLMASKAAGKQAGKKPPASARYKGKMKLSQLERQQQLIPLLEELRANGPAQDDKLSKLKRLIDERCRAVRSKVIVFVEFYETAVYLEKQLSKQFGAAVRVACTVYKKGEAYCLKTVAQRQFLQGRFAPKANEQPEPGGYEVLICTDADGVGVNLQDADTVINYDLSGGADTLVQRLGRILRPTTDAARMPHLYTFVPNWEDVPVTSRTRARIEKRLARFRIRNEKSTSVLKTTIWGTQAEEELSLNQDVELETLLHQADDLAAFLGATSTAAHIATLETHRNRADELFDSVMSARRFSGAAARLILIFEVEGRSLPASLVFSPDDETIVSEEEPEALRLLRCGADAARELVSPGLILSKATNALTLWCERHGHKLKHTKRLVTLYLLPEGEAGENSKFMNSAADDKRKRYRKQ